MFIRVGAKQLASWILVLVVASCGAAVRAEQPGRNVVLLWPGGAPGAVGSEDLDRPSLTVYLPPSDEATGAGVVVCPGGGYRVLAIDHEGQQVAHWLNSFGVAALVLKYRLKPRYQPSAALADAQRALRLVRADADALGISPHRLGILGFSAGGHLASAAGTHFDAGNPAAGDPIERQSCRPDFLVLAYAVTSSSIGKPRDYLSTAEKITPQTPPAFLFHTGEDTGVPPDHSIRFYQALRAAGVPAELHVFAYGRHGLGLAPGHPTAGAWTELAARWMRASGFLTDAARLPVSGLITVDGVPLNQGWITLIPTDSDAKPIASAFITHKMEGKFTIDAEHGPCAGRHRVEIRQVAANFFGTPSIDDVRLFAKHAPDAQTELTVDIQPEQNSVVLDVSTR